MSADGVLIAAHTVKLVRHVLTHDVRRNIYFGGWMITHAVEKTVKDDGSFGRRGWRGVRGRFTDTSGRSAGDVAGFEGSLSPCLSRLLEDRPLCRAGLFNNAMRQPSHSPDVLDRKLSLVIVGQLRDLVAEPVVHAVDPLVVPQTRPGLAPHTPCFDIRVVEK